MRNVTKNIISTVKVAAVAAFGMAAAPHSASAQEFYIGQLIPVGFNFCQRSTAAANGQLLAISSNTALFSLIGTFYGGDGRTTFALPDLRGRFPTHLGTGPGLQSRAIGQRGGSETKNLTTANMPSHSHRIAAVNQDGDKGGPVSDFLAKSNDSTRIYHDGPADVLMDPGMVVPFGSSAPFDVMNPYLVINWCIATQGLFPSRP